MEKKVRYKSVDITKGFLILLVIISHIPNLLYHSPQLIEWIHSFFMPAFFVCSGLFFRPMKTIPLLQKKTFTLLLPYFVFTIWGCVAWIGRTILKHDTEYKELYDFLLGGNNYNGVLWFLIAMLWINIIANEIVKIHNKYVQLFIVLIISFVAYHFQDISWLALYNFRASLLCLPFFLIPYIYKDYILSIIGSQRKKILIPSLLLMGVLYYYYHDMNNMAAGIVKWSYIPFYIYVFLITFFILYISNLIQEMKIGGIMAYIGERSLGIMCVHLVFILGQYFLLNITPDYWINVCILFTIVLFESIAFTNILLKYFPIALGRKA